VGFDAVNISAVIAAVGGLGVAAFGLVDAMKTLPGGGVSSLGYVYIERALQSFFKGQTRKAASGDVKRLFDTLHGNWINGTALADQKAIAKSLIKLRLNATTAEVFAHATGVDASILETTGQKMSHGTRLDAEESNVLGRFDLALTAILDDGYQHADQRYRNFTKLAAMVVSTILALLGGWSLTKGSATGYFWTPEMWLCVLAGLLATPLAPMTKDLASALSAGVKVAQVMRK